MLVAGTTPDIPSSLQRVVVCARTGDYGEAALALNRCIPLIQRELSKGKVDAAGMAKIAYSLETLGMMQKMGDWVAFADVIEYEFIALWKKLIKS